mgnify:CR=1 FL=1
MNIPEQVSHYTECYIAFLDLLGVRSLVKRAGQDRRLYEALVAALTETRDTSAFWREVRNLQTNESTGWRLQVQAFSDCVVLFIPTESNMLPWLLASVRRLWDRLIRLGVCLRGAVTIGGMHWDARWRAAGKPSENTEGEANATTAIAFGPGLVQAYELESQHAVYPRILIAEALFDHVEKLEKKGQPGISPFGKSPASRLSDFFRHDSDGLFHLDVLHPGVNRRDVILQTQESDENGSRILRNHFDETTREEWLHQVRTFIDKELAGCNDETVRSKYEWFARYYDNTLDVSDPFQASTNIPPPGAIPLKWTTLQPREATDG